MVPVLALAGAIWGIGAWRGVPSQARLTMVGLLFVAVLALNVALPPGNALREATGGSAGEWLVFAALVGLAVAYREGLRRLRARVRPENRPPAPRDPGAFAPGEVERYARHIALREIGGPGQATLKRARVLVVGAGGLGSAALLYLAGAGVGRIGVIDPDAVEPTNLQRQVIHTDARIGMPKVFSAQTAMNALNPYLEVRPYHRRLTGEIARDLVSEYDLVLDGSDNFETRYLVNRACAEAAVPLIGAALSQWEGQVSLWDPARGAPCYECVFPQAPAPELAPSCAEAGVLGPLPGIVGAIMAAEAVKEIAGAGQGLRGRLMIHDALWGESRSMSLERRADCPTCGGIRG